MAVVLDGMDLTDAQWTKLAPLLPKPHVSRDKRGRPWRETRDVLNGNLWFLRTGAPLVALSPLPSPRRSVPADTADAQT